MKRKSWVVRGLPRTSSLWLVAFAGCQQYPRITWDPPKPLGTGSGTRLVVGDLAELKLRKEAWDGGRKKGQIGRHTWTVFALPGFFIYPHKETPLKPSFDRAARDALHACGYELVDSSEAPVDTPVLRGEVNACWWWSYTWLWPLVVQGGQNKVTLVLESRDGKVLWKREFSRAEPGLPIGGAYGFGLMMKWSMTKLVQDMVKACSSEDFQKAVQTPGG